jgi:hypothetical protein
MLWKAIIAVSLIVIVAGGILWVHDGLHLFTKTRIAIETVAHDPLFGTEMRSVEWKDEFTYGLLPDDTTITAAPRGYIFIVGLNMTLIAVSFFMLRKARKAEQ